MLLNLMLPALNTSSWDGLSERTKETTLKVVKGVLPPPFVGSNPTPIAPFRI